MFFLEEGILDTDTQTHTYTQRTPCDSGETDCQGTQSIARHHNKLGERHGTDSPSEPPEAINLTNTLISVFLQTCERINFVLLSHQFVIPCYSNPRKLIHTPLPVHVFLLCALGFRIFLSSQTEKIDINASNCISTWKGVLVRATEWLSNSNQKSTFTGDVKGREIYFWRLYKLRPFNLCSSFLNTYKFFDTLGRERRAAVKKNSWNSVTH